MINFLGGVLIGILAELSLAAFPLSSNLTLF